MLMFNNIFRPIRFFFTSYTQQYPFFFSFKAQKKLQQRRRVVQVFLYFSAEILNTIMARTEALKCPYFSLIGAASSVIWF